MSRRRFIADESSSNRAALTGSNAEHLARVLRARVGQQFEIAVEGHIYLGTIAAISDERVEFTLGDELPAGEGPELDVLLAVFKFDRFEWAVEKLTELGVRRIVPVIARRTDAHLVKAAEKRAERWRRIAREAAQQARRSSAPEIAGPLPFKQALAPGKYASRIVLSEVEQHVALKQVEIKFPAALAIGPEGGWTADELKMFADSGWRSVTLGPTILRAETAAIAAVAAVNALAESGS